MELFQIGGTEDAYSGKTFWIMLGLLCVEIIMIAVLVPNRFIEDFIHKENNMLVNAYGYERANEAWKKSQKMYDILFVDTGITETIETHMFPTEEERQRSIGLEDLGKYDLFPWLRERGEALSMVIHQSLQRMYVSWSWIPFIFVLCLPSILDGIFTWKIRQYTFDYPSPVAYTYAGRIIGFSLMIALLSILVPFPINPLLIPMLFVLVLPITIMIIISNLPKSI